jgi:hypothetical protein
VTEPTRRRFRITAFRLGLVSGLATLAATLWVLHAWLSPSRSDGFNVDVASRGADVSQSGGAAVVVSHKRGRLTQSCVDGCDDLQFRAHDDENDYEVRVLDAEGACVACDRPRGIMGGYGGWSHRWRIAGEGPLKIRVDDEIGRLGWTSAGEVRSK